jgi:hypothetical protein
MEQMPIFVQNLLEQINWSKHFGPRWPKKLRHIPEWDREDYLEAIDFDGLVNLASSLRDGMPCEIVEEYLGAYNLIYYVEFEDSVQWVARIPIIDRIYECGDRQAGNKVRRVLFESMIAAQTFARVKKGVFAPTIYASFPDDENDADVPFAFMQKITAPWRLDEVIGHMSIPALRPVFSDLAREMVSLASPPYFTQIGSLRQVGEEFTVGPMLSYTSLHDDPVILDRRGPYSTVEEYFISALNRHISASFRDENRPLYIQANRLRALISDFIDPRYNSGPFILSPFDWEARNVFFTEDSEISGILDWDFSSVVPLQSFFRYPPFMTRDWILGTKSPLMEEYRKLFRECLGELQDETELPLLELLDQSRWFQMLDEGIQCTEMGRQVLPLLEAYVAAMNNKKVEVKPIPVVKGVPQLRDIKTGGKGKVAI